MNLRRIGGPALPVLAVSLVFAGVADAAEVSMPVRPDQALVYVIRPADPGGGDMVADYFFAGEQLLAVTKGKTHAGAYLPPGKHLLWCQGGAALLDLVPGQTYYVVCGFFHGFSLLDDAEEAATLMAETKPGPAIGPSQQEKARKRLERFYSSTNNAIRAEGWDQPSPPPLPVPADTSGLILVPAYTPVVLELMENLSSSVTPAGERVRFRVVSSGSAASPARIAPGSVAEGVVMAVRAASKGGGAGGLAIDVPALVLRPRDSA